MIGRSTLAPMQTVHATAVAIGGEGVLIRGPSGSGKSDLALRLIDEGAMLVADDRTELFVESGRVMARAPAGIAGKLEVRGMGIVCLPNLDVAPLTMVVDLVDSGRYERMPAANAVTMLGRPVPRLELAPFEDSATAKLRLILRVGPGAIER